MMRAIALLLFPALACASDCSPDVAEQKSTLEAITGNARNYAHALPNFIATRVAKRFLDSTGSGHQWRMLDTLEQQLTYFDHNETYKTIAVNGRPVKGAPDSEPGLTSGGEFGSVFEDIFEPKTLAAFKWKGCQSLRGVKMYVFDYRETKAPGVISFSQDPPNPGTNLFQQGMSRQMQASVPYHGLIYADRETRKVMRLTIVSETPPHFPMQNPERQLDYQWTLVGGGEYLLPSKVAVRAKLRGTLMRNEMEFLLYRKFEADSVLKFDKH